MSRLVLLPFHSTPANLQLDGGERDRADQAFKEAKAETVASRAASNMIELGRRIESAFQRSMPEILMKVRKALPAANTRVQRSYAWVMMATLQVYNMQ